MATINITSSSSIKEWIQVCNEFEQCEIESLKGDISFIESELIPTIETEQNNMYLLEFIPREFTGDGVSRLWAFIDNKSKLRKRPIFKRVKSHLSDGMGNEINSLKGAISVHDADVHDTPLNKYFFEYTVTTTTLSAIALAGAKQIAVVNATGLVVGNSIEIKDGNVESTFPMITIIVGTLITLDRPLDFTYAIGDIVTKINYNMAVNATLAAPRSFRLFSDVGLSAHIQVFNLSLIHSGAADGSMFGDIAGGLVNGVVLRAYNAELNQFRTFTTWKNNSQMALDSGSILFSDKAGGGAFGTFMAAHIKQNSGATPKISGGSYLELLIQDNLSTLTSMLVKGQGHFEGV